MKRRQNLDTPNEKKFDRIELVLLKYIHKNFVVYHPFY